MDHITLYAQAMEWVIKTLIPILTVVLPTAIYLHQNSRRDMDKKSDKENVDLKFREIDKDISEIKEDRRQMEVKIFSELKYIRNRVDQVADRN